MIFQTYLHVKFNTKVDDLREESTYMIDTVRKIRYQALILLEKFEKLMDRNFTPVE